MHQKNCSKKQHETHLKFVKYKTPMFENCYKAYPMSSPNPIKYLMIPEITVASQFKGIGKFVCPSFTPQSQNCSYIILQGECFSEYLHSKRNNQCFMTQQQIWTLLTSVIEALVAISNLSHHLKATVTHLKEYNIRMISSSSYKLIFHPQMISQYDAANNSLYKWSNFYLSPEELNNNFVQQKSIVFSLGVMILNICANKDSKRTIYRDDVFEINWNTVEEKIKIVQYYYSKEIVSFIRQCLKQKHQDRYDFAGLRCFLFRKLDKILTKQSILLSQILSADDKKNLSYDLSFPKNGSSYLESQSNCSEKTVNKTYKNNKKSKKFQQKKSNKNVQPAQKYSPKKDKSQFEQNEKKTGNKNNKLQPNLINQSSQESDYQQRKIIPQKTENKKNLQISIHNGNNDQESHNLGSNDGQQSHRSISNSNQQSQNLISPRNKLDVFNYRGTFGSRGSDYEETVKKIELINKQREPLLATAETSKFNERLTEKTNIPDSSNNQHKLSDIQVRPYSHEQTKTRPYSIPYYDHNNIQQKNLQPSNNIVHYENQIQTPKGFGQFLFHNTDNPQHNQYKNRQNQLEQKKQEQNIEQKIHKNISVKSPKNKFVNRQSFGIVSVEELQIPKPIDQLVTLKLQECLLPIQDLQKKINKLGVWIEGDVYYGDFRNGRRHGLGLQIFPNNEYYYGYFQEDLFHGEGFYFWNSNQYYLGTFINGQKVDGHLYGPVSYQGTFENSRRHGKGICWYANNQIYKGEWFKGNRHGQGIYIDIDKNIFMGKWVKGKRKGEGCLENEQFRIAGFWNGEHIEGQTLIQYKNGDVFHGTTGQFLQKLEGEYISKSGRIFRGSFENDQPRKGTLIHSNGDRYEGQLLNMKRNGYGEYYYTNGECYKGHWVDNKRIQN